MKWKDSTGREGRKRKFLINTRSLTRCSVMTYRGGIGGSEGESRRRGYMYT